MLGESVTSVCEERVWWAMFGRHLGTLLYLMLLLILHSHPPHTAAQYTESGAWVGVENNTMLNVKAQLGYTAFLPCSVRMIGDKQISWIRRRDWHVLTSGVYTYTNDERFSITHRDGADDWTLSIKYIQARDNGTYECQISTETGIVSQFVNVNVIVPEAFILGNSEYHVQTGSPINLFCIIEQTAIPPHVVYWKHNDRLLNYEAERGGVSVTIDHGTKTSSRLVISNAVTKDSGNYTCVAPNTQPAVVYVFVSQGDKTAAIQRKTSGCMGVMWACGWSWVIILVVISLQWGLPQPGSCYRVTTSGVSHTTLHTTPPPTFPHS